MYLKKDMNILIVDDTSENIKVLGAILMDEGYQVSIAASGKDAIDIVNKKLIHLILLDINMPGLDGYETCKYLKNDPKNKSIPIIFLTAYTGVEHKKKAFAEGGVDYITKPFEKEEVLARVKTHLEIETYRKYLEQEVENRTEELKITNKKLENEILKTKQAEEALIQTQKMETVGILAGGLAHDFNNVLSGITGASSFITHKLKVGKKLDDDKLLEYMDRINYATSRAAAMVGQLLSLSRKQEVSFALTDMNSIIKNIMKIAESSFDKSIKLNPVYFEGEAIVNADIRQIEQVVLNLCVNAAHAMTIMKNDGEKKGGELKISIKGFSADKYFCSKYPIAKEIDYYVLSVKDVGVGIKKEIKDKIFNPFFTTKKDGSGTGLGLAMAYNIINNHNGIIDVYSEEGWGTEFYIYLPVAKSEISADMKHKKKIELQMGEGLVLLIDDEEIVKSIAQEILEDCGYKVISTENGQTGLEIFRERHEDIKVVLLDANMPNISGLETYLEMKEIDPDVKVLITSGFQYDDKMKKIIKLGANEYIQKPYTYNDLVSKLYNVIEK